MRKLASFVTVKDMIPITESEYKYIANPANWKTNI